MIGPEELKRIRAMTRSISGSQQGEVTITKVTSSARFQLGKRPSGSTRHRLRSNRFFAETPVRDPFKRERPFTSLCWPFPFDPCNRRRDASTDLVRSFDFIPCRNPVCDHMQLAETSCRPWSNSRFPRVDQNYWSCNDGSSHLELCGPYRSDDGSIFRVAATNTLFHCQKCFLGIRRAVLNLRQLRCITVHPGKREHL